MCVCVEALGCVMLGDIEMDTVGIGNFSLSKYFSLSFFLEGYKSFF